MTKASLDKLFQKTYDYILVSEKLRIEINLEEDPAIILDKALRCISLMTGDMVFYETNRSKCSKL